jgi:hypothetical protein
VLFGTDDYGHVFSSDSETPLQWLKDMEKRRDFGISIYENLQVGYIDEKGRVTVNSSAQWPDHDLRQIAPMLKLPKEQVREIVPAIGGAFGGREDMHIQHLLALCAFCVRRPVKMVFDRHEVMIRTGKRHPWYVKYKTGAKKDGTLTAVEIEIVSDSGGYASTTVPVLEAGTSFAAGPYVVPNAKVEKLAPQIPQDLFREIQEIDSMFEEASGIVSVLQGKGESGVRSEDDLTHKLVDIIRINQRFKENQDAGAPHLIIEDLWELLQYHVTTYLDNEVAGCPPARHRSGRPLKTLSQRLKGKDGRFRGSLSGKRVNFSARTVISPDPNIKVTEVGVPLAVAREMTVPIRVTPFNKDEMREFIMRGPARSDIHSPVGANYVIRPDNRRLRLSDANLETVVAMVEPGWTVERQLRDGDIVLFNRQPSLHRMSIMAHRVRVMEGKTFRLNPAVCPPYNADFDGDEMNLHIPQSEEARTEALLLMQVHMIAGAAGKLPQIKNGVADLRESGMNGNFITRLNGEWEFYWKQLVTPQDFQNGKKPSLTGYFSIPDYWNGVHHMD